MDQRRNLRTTLASHVLFAAAAAMRFKMAAAAPATRKNRSHVPMMVTSSPAEIAAWNAEVERKRSPKRKAPRRQYETGQHPKFARERQRKQHKHQLHDEYGAHTRTGRNVPVYGTHAWDDGRVVGWTPGRRIWLAGISAQRGY